MTDFPDYCRATNAAYEILQKYKGDFPCVDVYQLLSSLPNVAIFTYSAMANKLNVSFREFYSNFASSNHGFTIYDTQKNKYLVCYNEFKDNTTVKFTLAHELAHIILKHNEDNERTDKEANCCARNIICPIPIVNNYQLKSVYDYMSCFNISKPMAKAAIDLAENDNYNITRQNYNAVDELAYFNISGYSPYELYGSFYR